MYVRGRGRVQAAFIIHCAEERRRPGKLERAANWHATDITQTCQSRTGYGSYFSRSLHDQIIVCSARTEKVQYISERTTFAVARTDWTLKGATWQLCTTSSTSANWSRVPPTDSQDILRLLKRRRAAPTIPRNEKENSLV